MRGHPLAPQVGSRGILKSKIRAVQPLPRLEETTTGKQGASGRELVAVLPAIMWTMLLAFAAPWYASTAAVKVFFIHCCSRIQAQTSLGVTLQGQGRSLKRLGPLLVEKVEAAGAKKTCVLRNQSDEREELFAAWARRIGLITEGKTPRVEGSYEGIVAS